MQDNIPSSDPDSVSLPSWDSSQLHLRPWLDDIAAWLPAQHSNHSPIIEFGCVLTSQGSVAAFNLDHALHCRSRLLVAHTFDNPLPRNPIFVAQGTALPQNLQATTRQTRSQAQTAATSTAAGTGAPAASGGSVSSSGGLPPLTTDEAKRYIIAPELIEATDRKMMSHILKTITCSAARRTYSQACNGS
eukprot:5091718-Pleurochrysis_carterae.AAC.1